MFREGVGRGTLNLYELVGEPYIYLYVGRGIVIRKNDGRGKDDRGKDVSTFMLQHSTMCVHTLVS